MDPEVCLQTNDVSVCESFFFFLPSKVTEMLVQKNQHNLIVQLQKFYNLKQRLSHLAFLKSAHVESDSLCMNLPHLRNSTWSANTHQLYQNPPGIDVDFKSRYIYIYIYLWCNWATQLRSSCNCLKSGFIAPFCTRVCLIRNGFSPCLYARARTATKSNLTTYSSCRWSWD